MCCVLLVNLSFKLSILCVLCVPIIFEFKAFMLLLLLSLCFFHQGDYFCCDPNIGRVDQESVLGINYLDKCERVNPYTLKWFSHFGSWNVAKSQIFETKVKIANAI